jgi:spore germination cell wall hydrolase CwlJ-like protein
LSGLLMGLLLLAQIIAGEAGTCGLEARIAVAHVATNREAAGIVGGWYGKA